MYRSRLIPSDFRPCCALLATYGYNRRPLHGAWEDPWFPRAAAGFGNCQLRRAGRNLMGRCVLTRGGPAGAFCHANRVDPTHSTAMAVVCEHATHQDLRVSCGTCGIQKAVPPRAAAYSYSEWRSSRNIHTERRCDVRHVYKLLGFKGSLLGLHTTPTARHII